MNNPFQSVLNKVFLVSVVLTLGWMFFMGASVKPFNSKQIVAFELAKTPEAAADIIKEWTEIGSMDMARKSIYLDFVFLVLYSVSIGLACLVLSHFTNNRFLILSGSWLSKIIGVAGFSDVVENLAMLSTLSGGPTAQTTGIAYWFAVIKFSIVIVSLLFIFICLAFGGLKRVLTK